ncbi:hypothetical protein [Methylibium sp. Root1272]|uniref:hypothetical protein n=1 Tax=Methylibium sp. Root1272 TaxID=1736441 RepID=UPI0012E8A6DC|nr:hypothetical protein [Methylibium sp. Root1272]
MHSILYTERKVQRNQRWRSGFVRVADVVVMLAVLKNAAWAVATSEFGSATDAPTVVAWYGLAALYVAARWTTQLTAGAITARLFGVAAAAVSALVAGMAMQPGLGPTLIGPHDWLALSCGFLCCAICGRSGHSSARFPIHDLKRHP